MNFTYPGDGGDKRYARLNVYQVASKAWKRQPPGGHAIVLAGQDAMEIPYLRDYLRWDPRRVLFVDVNPSGLRKVRREWPQAGTFHGQAWKAIDQVPSIGFLNLDFMGLFNKNVERALHAARGKLLPRSIIAYTFYRARENKVHHSFSRIQEATRAVLPEKANDPIAVRWVGTTMCLLDALGLSASRVNMLSTQQYSSNHSPMGVIVVQNGPNYSNHTERR